MRPFEPWSLRTVLVNMESSTALNDMVEEWTGERMCFRRPCFVGGQGTDHWKPTEIDVFGFTCDGSDVARTAILCPKELCDVRRLCETHELG